MPMSVGKKFYGKLKFCGFACVQGYPTGLCQENHSHKYYRNYIIKMYQNTNSFLVMVKGHVISMLLGPSTKFGSVLKNYQCMYMCIVSVFLDL